MNSILLYTIIILIIIYFLSINKEHYENDITEHIIAFFKQYNDPSYTMYVNYLNNLKNTNINLVSRDTFYFLKSLGDKITKNNINKLL